MSWRRALYSLLFYTLLPLMVLHLLWRGRKNRAYWQRWYERFGFVDKHSREDRPIICLHAVSVGETVAARPLVERLLADFPEYAVWVSTTTPTGSDAVRRLFGGRVLHSYLPYDTPFTVARFLKRVRPVLFLVMETELWPNLYAACWKRQIPLLLVNARLSARSVRRYQCVSGLISEVLSATTCVMTRTEQDAKRFLTLGAAPEQVQVAGDIKFAIPFDPAISARGQALREQWGKERLVWCAGSTHEGEDELLLSVHARMRKVMPGLLLILVPRHPERFERVAALCKEAGLPMIRRSSDLDVRSGTAVLLGDSMGELVLWYACSDVAFIGGSLVDFGGHNPLEALSVGVPVLSGQYVGNFSDMYNLLLGAQCARQVGNVSELQVNLRDWLEDENSRLSSGQAGQDLFSDNSDVIERLMQTVGVCIFAAKQPK